MLLLNSDEPAALRHSLPALADLPTAAMPLAAAPSGLPALGWQLPAARAAVQQLLAAGEWLRARVAAAQYAHLPLASIGGDWILDAADALYARQLRECCCCCCCWSTAVEWWRLTGHMHAGAKQLGVDAYHSQLASCAFCQHLPEMPAAANQLPAGEAGHLLWAADPSQPDLDTKQVG